MQIMNNPQIPSSNQASFGMALKITKPAMEALEKSSMKTIEDLSKIGEDLAKTKYYHLEIGNNLAPRIDSVYANAYYGKFDLIKPTDNYLTFRTFWDGSESSGLEKGASYKASIAFENKAAALNAYKKLSDMPYINKVAKLTEMLDAQQAKKVADDEAKAAELKKVKEAASKLMEKYGSDSNIK